MLGPKLARERMYLKSSSHRKEVGLAKDEHIPVITVCIMCKFCHYIHMWHVAG